MTNSRHDKYCDFESHPVDETMRKIFPPEVPETIEPRLQKTVDTFMRNIRDEVKLKHYSGWWMSRLAWTGAGAACTAAVVLFVMILLSKPTLTWAQVVDRFSSAQFFSAAIYIKDDATSQPEQIELWMGQDGSTRLRVKEQVVFGKSGQVIKGFDITKRKETEVHSKVIQLLEKLGSQHGFSLSTVINSFCGRELVDTTPLINNQAILSEDLVVFDVESDISPEWLRIWALRESKLPVRIRFWDPRDGDCVDAVFSYSKDQPEKFFDPEAFSQILKGPHTGKLTLAYMFLNDPGGKRITPPVLNEHRAFQIITKTIDSKPWTLSDHRGKVVLLTFWSNRIRDLNQHKDIFKKFGDREDFIMVGVALDPEAESARAYCRKEGVQWLQLHEPVKPWKTETGLIFGEPGNSLAQALAVKNSSIVLVQKDGTMEELHTVQEAVEAALVGLTYNSHHRIVQALRLRQEQKALSSQDIIEICGISYRVDHTPIGRKRWTYKLFNENKTHTRTINVEFNEDDSVASWGSGSMLVDPAEVTITFTSNFIARNIEGKVEPEISDRIGKDYLIKISARAGNRGYPFGNASIQSDKSYSRKMPPGVFDFVINIGPANEHGTITEIVKNISLLKDVELSRNEKKTLRFE